jgi:hypothetical protein
MLAIRTVSALPLDLTDYVAGSLLATGASGHDYSLAP